jgi:hypothetical protein
MFYNSLSRGTKKTTPRVADATECIATSLAQLSHRTMLLAEVHHRIPHQSLVLSFDPFIFAPLLILMWLILRSLTVVSWSC